MLVFSTQYCFDHCLCSLTQIYTELSCIIRIVFIDTKAFLQYRNVTIIFQDQSFACILYYLWNKIVKLIEGCHFDRLNQLLNDKNVHFKNKWQMLCWHCWLWHIADTVTNVASWKMFRCTTADVDNLLGECSFFFNLFVLDILKNNNKIWFIKH